MSCPVIRGHCGTAGAVPMILITGALSIVVVLAPAAVMWESLHLEVMDHHRQDGLKRQGHLKRKKEKQTFGETIVSLVSQNDLK